MTFEQKNNAKVKINNSLVCVGLDSDINKIPNHLIRIKHQQFEFNREIIDATHDLVCAYKPNSAFYEVRGEHGILQLKMTIDYIKEKQPIPNGMGLRMTRHGFAYDFIPRSQYGIGFQWDIDL